MAHALFDAALTARVAGDALAASTAQASRMVAGAVALRDAQCRAAAARVGRAAAEDRLARAVEARAAFRASRY